MNHDERMVWPAGALFFGACLVFAALTAAVRWSAPLPAVDADRAAVLSKALAQIRATQAVALNEPGWIDQNRGLVRLPIDLAMQITEQKWQNPAAARAGLAARAEKAAAPAPAAPAKPSIFE